MQFLAKFVMQGQFQALMITASLAVLSQAMLPLAILSGGYSALFLLRKGEKKGLPLFISIFIITLISNQFIETRPGLGFPLIIVILCPIWVSATILRKTQSQGLAIAFALFCAAALAIAVQVYSGDAEQWWKDWLRLAISGVQNTAYEGFENSSALTVMNGIVAMMMGFATVCSLFLGRWMQATLYQPGGFKQEFHSIRVPKLIFFIVILILLVAMVINENLFTDLLIIFSVIYFFQGLSVLHCNVDRLGRSAMYLLPPYVLLLFTPQFVIVGMAGLGLVDTFVNFRKLPE